MSEISYSNCPKCSSRIEENFGYITWCPECEWNVQPNVDEKKKTITDLLNLKLGKRFHEMWHKEKAEDLAQKNKISFGIIVANILAIIILSFNFFFLFLAIKCFMIARGNWLLYLLGVFFISLLFLINPIKITLKKQKAASKTEFPELYKLVAEIAERNSVKHDYEIHFSSEYNASMYMDFIRRKRVLTIGLPLWATLDADERVALLAHEIAHDKNGDILRSRLPFYALNTLNHWYSIFEYYRIPDEGILSLFIWLFDMAYKLVLRAIIRAAVWIILVLIRKNGQRDEYLADYGAAEIVGTDAVLSLFKKLYLGDYLKFALSEIRRNYKDNNTLSKLRMQFDSFPEKEIERIKRIETREGVSIDSTHPSTNLRISFLEKNYIHDSKYVLEQRISKEIDRELNQLYEAVSREKMAL